MSDEMRQIGLRLKGLREALDMTAQQFADSCNIPLVEYQEYESGEKDLTINVVKGIAMKHNIDVSALMFGDEPRMSSYSLTRKGNGAAVKRVESYQYQSLAAGFTNRKSEIFEVTVQPKSDDIEVNQNTHAGQEFNFVLEGRMLLYINGKELTLEEGDSLYFDSSLPHGMKALDGKPVRFIAVVM